MLKRLKKWFKVVEIATIGGKISQDAKVVLKASVSIALVLINNIEIMDKNGDPPIPTGKKSNFQQRSQISYVLPSTQS